MTTFFPPFRRPSLRLAGRAALATATVLLTAGLALSTIRFAREQARHRYVFDLTRRANETQVRSQSSLSRHVGDLETLADVVARWPEMNRDEFDERAAPVMTANDAYRALNVVDVDGVVTRAYAADGRRTEEGLNVATHPGAREASRRAGSEGRPTVTTPIALPGHRWAARFYAPVVREFRPAGLVEGLFHIERFVDRVLRSIVGGNADVTLIDESTGRVLGSTRPEKNTRRSPALDGAFILRAADRTWWVVVHPHRAPPVLFLTAALVTMELALGAGLLILIFRRSSHA
jgi:sensor domain CHASE-containing protein